MSGISIYPDNGPGRKPGPTEKKIDDLFDTIVLSIFFGFTLFLFVILIIDLATRLLFY